MNVKFIKNWENPETGKVHHRDTFHKIGTSAARQLIKQGYCLEMPEHLGLLQLYKNPELIDAKYYPSIEPDDIPDNGELDGIDAVNDDLGTVTKAKGFFNRK